MNRTPLRLALASAIAVAVSAAAEAPPAFASSIASAKPPSTVARSRAISLRAMARALPAREAHLSRSGTLTVRNAVALPSRTVCARMWFTATTLIWRQTAGGRVTARMATGPRRGAVGEPAILASEPSEGPSPGSPEYHRARRGTELLWTGGSRCLRFSLRLPKGASISHLRASFINTSGTAAGPRSAPPDATTFPKGISGASYGAPRPPMVTRAQWGAQRRYFNTGSSGCTAPYYNRNIRMMFVHHTAGTNDYSASQSDDIVRAIYYYHTQDRGYCDIAYNFLIDRFGTIFEGRAGGVGRPVQPASQMGFNPETSSAALIGNFQTAKASTATVLSLEELLAWRLDEAHLSPLGQATMVSEGDSTTRYRAGTKVVLPVIAGHRDTGLTACPGSYVYRNLESIRSAVEAIGAPKIFSPRASTPQVAPGGNPVRFHADATGPITWRVRILRDDGVTVRTMFRSGEILRLSWNGTTADGLPVQSGTYRAVIGGQDASRTSARPAAFPLAVLPPATK